jgi:large subunit ribosomal protein L6
MSRIGKQHVQIPDGVKVTMSGAVVSVVGPKGTLTREFKTDIIEMERELKDFKSSAKLL